MFPSAARALSDDPCLERVAGIEPAPSAWKAEVLPLNYTRRCRRRLASLKALPAVLSLPGASPSRFVFMRGASPSRSQAEGSFMRGANPSRCLFVRGASPSRSPAEGSFMRGANPSHSPGDPRAQAGGGGGRIRTYEGEAIRFTVWSLWPLGNPSGNPTQKARNCALPRAACQRCGVRPSRGRARPRKSERDPALTVPEDRPRSSFRLWCRHKESNPGPSHYK